MPNSEGLTSIKDPKQRYTKAQCIGRGASKVVYKAFDEVEGIEVAWNEVLCSDACLGSGKERSRMLGEITMLRQLKHKNIMRLYDWWYDKQQQVLVFITELLTDGSLRRFIRRKHAQGITLSVLKRYAWQILQGLVYLHGHYPPIIHRDLKCDNIFVNGASGELKIGDLGFATLMRGMSAPLSVIGTPEFMAPELYDEHYDEKVDTYSYGMCLLELATLEYPYSECTNPAQIYRKVTRGIPPAALDKVGDPQLKEFILLTINPDPSRRPEARQLLCHPFFEDLRQQIRAKGWLKGPAPALGAAAAAADHVRQAAAAVAGAPAGSPAALRVPMSAPDGLAAIAAAVQAADVAGSGEGRQAQQLLPPAAATAAASESVLLQRQQQQELLLRLRLGPQQQQTEQQPATGVVDTRPPAAAIADALLELDRIHSSAAKQTPDSADQKAMTGPDIQQQQDQLQQQQQPANSASTAANVLQQQQQQMPDVHPSSFRTSSAPPGLTIRVDNSGGIPACQTPVASPFADASWASCSSVEGWASGRQHSGAAGATSNDVRAPVAAAVGDMSPVRAAARHHAATKGRRHSLDELSEDDVVFDADSQSRSDDVESEQDESSAATPGSPTMAEVWQHMPHSAGLQQHPQQQQHPIPAPTGAVPGHLQCLDTIHEASDDDACDDDDYEGVDCVCRRIDHQQLSFNVGFFNRGMRKRVGFQYNAEEDTVDDIAVEMLENLSLLPQQAEAIATKIRAALEALGMSHGAKSNSNSCASGPCSIGPVLPSAITSAAGGSSPAAADGGAALMTGKNAAIAIVATAAASAAIERCTPQHGSVDAGSSLAAGSGHSGSSLGSYANGGGVEGVTSQICATPSPAGTPHALVRPFAMSRLGPHYHSTAGGVIPTTSSVDHIIVNGNSINNAAAVHACTEQLVRELSMLDRDQGQALLQTLQEDLLIQSIAMPEVAAAVGVELGVPLASPQASPTGGLLAAAVAADENK